MRIKMLATVLLAGFLSLSANAGFEQFNPVNGAINVFELGGGYISTITPYGLDDVRSITTNNLAFELKPNINLYGDGSDPYWANGAFGAKDLEGLTLWEMAPDTDHELTADINYVQFTTIYNKRIKIKFTQVFPWINLIILCNQIGPNIKSMFNSPNG